jgi:hypothetical protein
MFYLPRNFELTSKLDKVLREQIIDEQGPGVIVEDFQRLLNFVGEQGVPVTGTYLLPLKLLQPINELLSRPIQLGLKRPQQKSYPHINGLFMLVRTTGLGKITMKTKKPHLIIHPDVLQFDFDHLYQFTYTNRFGASRRIMHPYMEEPPSADEIQIGDVPLEPGMSMTFLYDFGDNWTFEVNLEQIAPLDPKMTKPKILETHGDAPEQYGW